MTTEDLLARVLRPTREERARVAEELLSSPEEPEEQVAVVWARELERRSRDNGDGKGQTVEWETVRVPDDETCGKLASRWSHGTYDDSGAKRL